MSEVDNRCEHQKHDWKHGMKQMCLECYDEEHAELQLLRGKLERAIAYLESIPVRLKTPGQGNPKIAVAKIVSMAVADLRGGK